MDDRSNGSRDIREKVVCSPSKVPLITQLSQPRLHNFFAYVKNSNMKFEPTPSNGWRDTTKRSLYFMESALNY